MMKFFKIQNFCILSFLLVFFVFITDRNNGTFATDSEADQDVAQMLHDVKNYYENFILSVNKSVVLVLGNKAAGKSVLTRLLTTNSDQISVKGSKLEFNGQRTIPETIVPTLLIDSSTNTSFYDCPVVDDAAAEITADITAALAIQKLLAHAREFKILFVITAESMSNANDTNDFIKLAESAVDLIKDTRKYSDGIALIVRTIESSNGTAAVDFDVQRDRDLINKCIDFLKRTQLKLARPKFQVNAAAAAIDDDSDDDSDDDNDDDDEENAERINREKISFISALFKNERIKILRLPMRIEALQHQKAEILAMINDELRFVPKDDDDFLCKINDKSKQQIPSLIAELKTRMEDEMPKSIAVLHELYVSAEQRNQITLNVMAEILSISEHLNPNALKLPPNIERGRVISYDLQKNIEIFDFLQQFNANDEIRVLNISAELRSQLRHKIDDTFRVETVAILNAIKAIYLQKAKDFYLEIDKIDAIVAEAHAKFSKINSGTREMFMIELFDLVAELEIDGLNGNMRRLSRNLELITVLGDTDQPIAERLASEFGEWREYFEHSKIWYGFVRELRDQLSNYAVQQNKSVMNVPFMKVYIIGDDDDTVGPHIIELQTPLSYLANDSMIDRNAIESVRVSRYMLKSLQAVWSSSMSENTIECDAANRIRVKGDFISIRHAIEMAGDCWSSAKQIEIFALNTVFIDADVDKRDENVNFTIFSPIWQTIASAQPRQILLIGKNISEEWPMAKNGSIENDRNGTNGRQGIRGGAGGNILCVGQWFINDERLRIDVSGGKGGPGQIGGNGADGVRGATPPVLIKADNQVQGFKCKDRETLSFQNGTQYTNYTCFGKSGIPPGNGGDGGCGGFGGDPGVFYIIGLQNATTNIEVINRTGETGPDVDGGIGGWETTFGNDTHFQSHYTEGLFGTKLFEKWYRILQGSDPGAKIERGSNGTYPKNCSTIHPAIPVHFDVQPSVIAYKQFVWQNLAQNAWKTNLTDFIDKLQNADTIRSLFHVNGYIDEFLSLENDYFHLINDIDFYPMYQFLRHRFEQREQKQQQHPPKIENLFYAALISKMLAIRNHSLIATISDLLSDQSSMKNNIEALNSDRIGYIKRMRDASKISLEARIQSASETAASALTAINKISNLTDENRCDECIEQLQVQMIRHQIVTPMKIIQSFLSLMAQDVAVLMKAASVESLPLIVTTASAPYAAQMSQIVEQFHFKSHQFKELLDDFDGILKQDTSNRLNEIQRMVTDLARKIDEILASDRIPTENTVAALIFGQTNLTNAVENVKSQFEKRKDKTSERLDRMHSLLKCSALGIETFRNCRNNPKKLIALNEQIDQFQGNLRRWTEYEQSIYWIVLPRLKQIEKSIQNASVLNDTHCTFDVSNWNVQPALAELELIFNRIRRRPLYDRYLEHSVDLIKQQIKIWFGLYNHIHVYADREQLVALLENIEKAASNDQQEDVEIETKMAILNDSIYSNLILELCRTTVQVQKMVVFPMARDYSKLCEISAPPAVITNTSSQLIKKEFLQKIDNFIQKIEFTESHQQFYRWRYQDFKEEIRELLNGKAVTFDADISTANASIELNAPKLKKIQLNFLLANETKQTEFDDVLKSFQVRMTMIGSNYFKCIRQIHSIPIDVDVSFEFKIENNATISTESNGIDSKIMQMKPFLSPFSVWNVKLVSETNDFDQFKAFENDEIELQLSGTASFASGNDGDGQHVCNDELNRNYQLDRIL